MKKRIPTNALDFHLWGSQTNGYIVSVIDIRAGYDCYGVPRRELKRFRFPAAILAGYPDFEAAYKEASRAVESMRSTLRLRPDLARRDAGLEA